MYKLISKFLDKRDSETWHDHAREFLSFMGKSRMTLKILEHTLGGVRGRFEDPRLHVDLPGEVHLDNPVMVGAGWDKKGEAVAGLFHLGFSGVEVGSVLLNPQIGNDKPRQFFTKGVGLNRLGFNSPGVEKVRENLERWRKYNIPIGINIGKNKDIPNEKAAEVYAQVAAELYPYASYFTINVSSPNTPGLRELQDKPQLIELLNYTNEAVNPVGHKRKAIFIKVAPDLTFDALDDVIEVMNTHGADGIITSNTTINEDIKTKYQWSGQAGGVSGNDQDYRTMVNQQISFINRQTSGKLTIIGVGGVNDTKTALEKIALGATAVQIVTGIREKGPTLANDINRGIARFMDKHGMESIEEIRKAGKEVLELLNRAF